MLNISGTRAMHGTLLSERHVAEYYSILVATFFGIVMRDDLLSNAFCIHFMLCMSPI